MVKRILVGTRKCCTACLSKTTYRGCQYYKAETKHSDNVCIFNDVATEILRATYNNYFSGVYLSDCLKELGSRLRRDMFCTSTQRMSTQFLVTLYLWAIQRSMMACLWNATVDRTKRKTFAKHNTDLLCDLKSDSGVKWKHNILHYNGLKAYKRSAVEDSEAENDFSTNISSFRHSLPFCLDTFSSAIVVFCYHVNFNVSDNELGGWQRFGGQN